MILPILPEVVGSKYINSLPFRTDGAPGFDFCFSEDRDLRRWYLAPPGSSLSWPRQEGRTES